MTQSDEPYDDDALAAEYVLRLLDAEAEAQFVARLRSEQALRQQVLAWEAHFVALADEVDEVPPPAAVKAAVMAVVGAQKKRSAWRRWPALASGLAAAAAVAGFVFFAGTRPDLSPAFQAQLATEDGSLILVAGVIPATHEIVIDRIAGDAPSGGVRELWLIAEGAAAPVSLGLLNPDGATRITVPDEIAPGVRTGTIAISLEPPGGSPTGAPTGPVLATATFTDI